MEIDLSHNELSAWPEGLGCAGVPMERVILSYNAISELPPAASKVMSDHLKELVLERNCISAVRGVSLECQV